MPEAMGKARLEPGSPHTRAIVLCPLKHEARVLRRALAHTPCDVQCCGHGDQGLRAWADRGHATHADRAPAVVLAGLAGSVRTGFPAGEAHVIGEVRDAAGAVIGQPTLTRNRSSQLVVAQIDDVVSEHAQRNSLAQNSGADLIDQESASFARLAQARGWRWGIVRGISDDPSSPLPARVSAWVTPAGGTRVFAVLGDVLRRPALLAELKRLHDNSRSALIASAAHVRALLDEARDGRNEQIG